MTAPTTITPPTPPGGGASPRGSSEARALVTRRVTGLQEGYLRNDAQARAALAALRSAVSMRPGEAPSIWSLTDVPSAATAGDAPTREEWAVHTAMTLYAVHQQSRTEGVHVPGRGLGAAARALIGPPDAEDPSARKRFDALVTSATLAELRHHLRGFVARLRARGVPLDYGQLAADLVLFQTPGGTRSVKLRWSRQYAARAPMAPAVHSNDTTPTPNTSTQKD